MNLRITVPSIDWDSKDKEAREMHATKRAIINSFAHRTHDGKITEDDEKLARKITNFHNVPK